MESRSIPHKKGSQRQLSLSFDEHSEHDGSDPTTSATVPVVRRGRLEAVCCSREISAFQGDYYGSVDYRDFVVVRK